MFYNEIPKLKLGLHQIRLWKLALFGNLVNIDLAEIGIFFSLYGIPENIVLVVIGGFITVARDYRDRKSVV